MYLWYRDDFTAYADVCFREFGDRVAHWTTVLEPNILAQGSYDNGIVPPGHCSSPFGRNCTMGNSSVEPYLFLHHTLLAHSSTVRLYREKYQVDHCYPFWVFCFFEFSWYQTWTDLFPHCICFLILGGSEGCGRHKSVLFGHLPSDEFTWRYQGNWKSQRLLVRLVRQVSQPNMSCRI